MCSGVKLIVLDPEVQCGSVRSAILIFFLIYVPVEMFSLMVASGLTTGVLGGYLAYQLVHHATHFRQSVPGSFLYRARVRHSGHHYHRELGNFGITTALWDQVFGTA